MSISFTSFTVWAENAASTENLRAMRALAAKRAPENRRCQQPRGARHPIRPRLGVATNEGTWVISSYSVASAIAVPLTGWLARRVGEVKLFTISVLLFSIASALCGLSHNFESLIAFRLLQGLVSGPMVPLSQTSSCAAIGRKSGGSRSVSGR